MLHLTLIYIAGIVSGVVLLTIALAGWITSAAKKIDDNRRDRILEHGAPATDTSATGIASETPLAQYNARRYRGRHRPAAPAA